jgi:hypothetical protein
MIELEAKSRGLTVIQRYLYQHYLHHKKKYPNAPCFCPRHTGRADRLHEYFNALQKLEDCGLISVDRSTDNYRAWVMNAPRFK